MFIPCEMVDLCFWSVVIFLFFYGLYTNKNKKNTIRDPDLTIPPRSESTNCKFCKYTDRDYPCEFCKYDSGSESEPPIRPRAESPNPLRRRRAASH